MGPSSPWGCLGQPRRGLYHRGCKALRPEQGVWGREAGGSCHCHMVLDDALRSQLTDLEAAHARGALTLAEVGAERQKIIRKLPKVPHGRPCASARGRARATGPTTTTTRIARAAASKNARRRAANVGCAVSGVERAHGQSVRTRTQCEPNFMHEHPRLASLCANNGRLRRRRSTGTAVRCWRTTRRAQDPEIACVV